MSQRRRKDPYEDFKEQLKRRDATPAESDPSSHDGEDEDLGEEEEIVGSEKLSGSSWDPLEDDEEEIDEFDEELSESELDGSAQAANEQKQEVSPIYLANRRKYPFFRAVMLETTIDGLFISEVIFEQLLYTISGSKALQISVSELDTEHWVHWRRTVAT